MSADGISAYADLRRLTGNPEAKIKNYKLKN